MPVDNTTKLNNPDIFGQVSSFFDRVLMEDSAYEAYLFRLNLTRILEKQKLKEENKNLYGEYEKMLTKAGWVSLFLLNENDIFSLLEKDFLASLEIELYDVWRKLRYKLISMAVFKDRERFKKKAKEALERNQQRITATNLFKEGKAVPGTVANWLNDFRVEVEEMAKKGSRLGLSEYLTGNKNIHSLSDQDKEKVKKLLQLYGKLRISSFDLEGIEESIVFVDKKADKMTLFENGVFEDITRDWHAVRKSLGLKAAAGAKEGSDFQGEIAKIKARYRGNEAENQAIDEEKKSVEKLGGDFSSVIRYLNKAIENKDKIKTVAALYNLAEERKLDNLLEEDSFIRTAVINKLKDSPKELADFKVNPADSRYMVILLRFIFEEILGLSENESARFGLHIINILKKQGIDYKRIAYFDMKDRLFKWL